MNLSNPFLSVVVPAYNEERNLPATLNLILAYLKKQNYSWEVIVVNDGSTDHTKELALEFQQAANLIFVDYQPNRGKGFAVKSGVQQAKGELILFMDADNSTEISELEKVLVEVKNGAEIVIGSRRLKDSKISKRQPWQRRLAGDLFRIYAKLLFGFSYNDTQAGFKAFTRRASRVFDYQTVWRWSFDVEILWLAKLLDLTVKEISISWENNEQSHVTFLGALNWPWDLLKIRLRRYNLNN